MVTGVRHDDERDDDRSHRRVSIMSSLDAGWFRLITNILIQSRDLAMIARWHQCGTMTSQMLARASFPPSVWPSSRSNFDLGPSPSDGGLAHYVNARGKMMSSRLWVASRARAIADHSQTESGRPFLFTFPFETLKSCCVLGCFSGAGRDRTISFHRLPPINRPRLTKVLHNLRTKRVCGASTSSAWGKALWMCQVFCPFWKQRQPRPISKRRGLEPDTDEETDAGANWQSEQVHDVLRWWSWSTSPCRVRSWPSHWIHARHLWHRMAWLINATQYFSCKASWRWNLSRFAEPS